MGKRGTLVGNRNAVKQGFYSKILTERENLDMEEAKKIEGLDDELALLRIKLRYLLENNPDRIDLHIKAFNMLVRIVRTRHGIIPKEREKLKAAIGNVIPEVAIPLGLK